MSILEMQIVFATTASLIVVILLLLRKVLEQKKTIRRQEKIINPTKLNPCSVCGSDYVGLMYTGGPPGHTGPSMMRAYCSPCSRYGLSFVEREDVAEDWNKRNPLRKAKKALANRAEAVAS